MLSFLIFTVRKFFLVINLNSHAIHFFCSICHPLYKEKIKVEHFSVNCDKKNNKYMFSFSSMLFFLYQTGLNQRSRTIKKYSQRFITRSVCMWLWGWLGKSRYIGQAGCQEGQAGTLEHGWKLLSTGKIYYFQGSLSSALTVFQLIE